KASSMDSSAANDHTRARICEAGEYAACASQVPSAAMTATVSPGAGSPSTRSMAPENIHGCRCRSDLSRPGLRVTTGPAQVRGSANGAGTETPTGLRPPRRRPRSAERDTKEASDAERDPACERAQQQHARTRIPRAAPSEQRERGAD